MTTPIYYVNDVPHLGHASTTVLADIFARWHRLLGEEVFFLTGTDEHGEKIQKAAAKAEKEPKEFVDSIVDNFKKVWERLRISNDYFIRTTDEQHIEAVKKFIPLLFSKDDIYKGEYEGWYCTPDETFVLESQLVGGKCPSCGRDVVKIKEEAYFFRLSKYQDKLLEMYNANPLFLEPAYSNEIINRVKSGLKDLDISRTTVTWAIPFPSDEKHFVYVWIDALTNYITALGWPGSEQFKKFWPADVHIMGKEINWFHSVIWPAMLMSAGIELPKRIFVHGWWTVEGQKMSKSIGNVVSPIAISDKYSSDALRYFIAREMSPGIDSDFSEAKLIERINNELVADLGNLVYRVLTIAEKYPGKIEGSAELEKELDLEPVKAAMEKLDARGALEHIWRFIKAANKYVNDKAIWKLEGAELSNALYNLLEAMRIISILIEPYMPDASAEISKQIGTKQGKLADCKFGKFEGKISKSSYLFKKVDVKKGA